MSVDTDTKQDKSIRKLIYRVSVKENRIQRSNRFDFLHPLAFLDVFLFMDQSCPMSVTLGQIVLLPPPPKFDVQYVTWFHRCFLQITNPRKSCVYMSMIDMIARCGHTRSCLQMEIKILHEWVNSCTRSFYAVLNQTLQEFHWQKTSRILPSVFPHTLLWYPKPEKGCNLRLIGQYSYLRFPYRPVSP